MLQKQLCEIRGIPNHGQVCLRLRDVLSKPQFPGIVWARFLVYQVTGCHLDRQRLLSSQQSVGMRDY